MVLTGPGRGQGRARADPPRSWCGVHAARCEPASFDAAPSKVSISWQTRLRIQSRQNWSLASQRICHLCAATFRPSVVRLGLPSSSPLLCDRSSVEVGGVPAPTPLDRGAASTSFDDVATEDPFGSSDSLVPRDAVSRSTSLDDPATGCSG